MKQGADGCYQQGKYAEAVEMYGRCLRLDDNLWQALSNRCAARLKISDFVGAIEDANQALQLQPNNTKLLGRYQLPTLPQAAQGFATSCIITLHDQRHHCHIIGT